MTSQRRYLSRIGVVYLTSSSCIPRFVYGLQETQWQNKLSLISVKAPNINAMKQREVTEESGTRWTCVQAYGGLNSDAAREAEDIVENEKQKIPVVCTPSGGAQSVRLHLDSGWEKELSDTELLDKIRKQS